MTWQKINLKKEYDLKDFTKVNNYLSIEIQRKKNRRLLTKSKIKNWRNGKEIQPGRGAKPTHTSMH